MQKPQIPKKQVGNFSVKQHIAPPLVLEQIDHHGTTIDLVTQATTLHIEKEVANGNVSQNIENMPVEIPDSPVIQSAKEDTSITTMSQDALADQNIFLHNPFDALYRVDDKIEGEALLEELGALEVYAGRFVDVINSHKATPDENVSQESMCATVSKAQLVTTSYAS